MKNKIEYFLLLGLISITRLFPLNKLNIPAAFITKVILTFFPVRKDVAFSNLQTAFPERNLRELEKILKDNYYSFVYTLLEIFSVKRMTKEYINNQIKFENIEQVVNTINEGKGLVFLTAHFGNWELGAIAAGIQLKSEINVIVKPQRNPYVTEWLNGIREYFGNKVVPLGMSIRQVYSILKERKPIGVVGDQRGPKDGLRVKFFGKDTAVFQGSVELALKTGTPIFTVFIKRLHDGSCLAEFKELSMENLPDNDEEKIKELMQRYMTRLEEQIRENPDHWFWMHNIWKY